MPHFTVHLPEAALTEQTAPAIIHHLTEAAVGVYGDWAREIAVVDLFGVPAGRTGVGGQPDEAAPPVVTLTSREGALVREGVPAALIAAIASAMGEALGADAGARVTTTLTGVPAGRSGVGGAPV